MHQTNISCTRPLSASLSHASDPACKHQTLTAHPRPRSHAPDPPCIHQSHVAWIRPTSHAPDCPCTPQTHISCTRFSLQAPAPHLFMQHPKEPPAPWGLAGAGAALQLALYYLMVSFSISKGTQEHPSGLMSRVLCSLLPTRSALWLSHRTHCWVPLLLIKSQCSQPLWETGTLCLKMQILLSGGPRMGVRGAVPVLPSRQCCTEAGDVVCG